MTDLIILAMMLAGSKHGYQLKQEAGLILGQKALHNNLVYPLLRRFLKEGWVSKKTVPGERGQTRQQYSLTAEGRRVLIERLSHFTETEAASENEFRTRVGLFALLTHESRENILSLREGYLQRLDQQLATLQANMELGKYGGEAVSHLRERIELDLKWVQHLRRISKSDQRRSS